MSNIITDIIGGSAHYEYTTTRDGFIVGINKVGGGTVGKRYDGKWEATVLNGETLIFNADPITTGLMRTHSEVVDLAIDFAMDEV